LGFAASIAISSKYSAVLVLPFVFYILLSSSIHKKRDFLVCSICLVLGMVVINFPALESLTKVSNSFGHEIDSLSGESKIATRRVPHGVYSNVYWQSSTPILILLLVVYFISVWRKTSKVTPFEWVFLLFPLLYIVVLSFVPKTHHRYFLPVALMLACLSAVGLREILYFKHGRWIACGLVFLSVAWQCPRLLAAYQGFSQDFKAEALVFIETNIPPNAVVLEDKNVNLPATPRVIKRRLVPSDTLEALRADGITHVVVSSRQYGGLFLESSRPKKAGDENFQKMRALYESLFQEGQLLKEWKTGGNLYLAPPLQIYLIEKRE
jgi:4-amino-4-deoxy-L-arabinose transferase-like glycosyltransferase